MRSPFCRTGLVVLSAALAAFRGGTSLAADAGLANFSARAQLSAAAPAVTVGFVVEGDGNSYLLRGVGPTLSTFGVGGALGDPVLSLYRGSTLLARNDNWGSAFIPPPCGAFALPATSLDAAVWAALDRGVYSVQLTANGASSGAALLELYDARTGAAGRLTNISYRANAGTGDNALVAGFSISGRAPRTIMLRAVGPSLAGFGVTGTLADPKLELFEAGVNAPFMTNDDWAGATLVRVAAEQAGAFALAGTKDAAMLVTLPAGSYSARVTGPAGNSGTVLLELYDEPVRTYPAASATNVVYQHGDYIYYTASGGYNHPNGGKTLVNSGFLRLHIFDEGVVNPNSGQKVMSLVETQLYDGAFVSPTGVQQPVRILGYPTTRYFVQDDYGTIIYQGEKVPEGVDASGAPNYRAYWYAQPNIQYNAPFVVGATKVTPYVKRAATGSTQHLGDFNTKVESVETTAVPLGQFQTYRVRLVETNRDPGAGNAIIASRTQNIHPDIGIVRFDFYSASPTDTGTIVMGLAETNLPYLGGNVFPLSQGNRLPTMRAGDWRRYRRSGYYIGNDGTVEEISGWFTMEFRDERVVNPVTNKAVLTLLETHHTETEATTLAGVVTRSTEHAAFKRYVEFDPAGDFALSGDTLPTGDTVWFDRPAVPINFPYSIGQTKTQTMTAYAWSNGRAVPVFTNTPTMKVLSVVPVRTTLGTYESYRMSYEDTSGYRVQQYTYPLVGVTRFTYPAPAGKSGQMDLTLTAYSQQ